ncbi:hypothetical protein [Bacillus wiedmannii]|uniref:hypothetical protein n=1 Tax=Bacillus wiedmannii TaxID=1890302 RepID=UPI0034675347
MAFEKYSEYTCVNFNLLNKNLNTNQQGLYYSQWKKKYDKILAGNNAIIEWDIRSRKALKEIATSATFFKEAELVRKSNCYSAYYFLCYYSLFHAMLSTLYLNCENELEKLINISHKKVQSIFVSTYRTKNNPIISTDINKHFTLLKSLREYYSYSMPMNEFFPDYDFEQPDTFLEIDIKQCFQLTSLHSLILSNSCLGEHKAISTNELSQSELHMFRGLFEKVNAKKHPLKNYYILDPADKNVLDEMYHYGFKVEHINLDIDHFIDEFKTYQSGHDNDNENSLSISEIDSFFYRTLI